MARPAKIGSSIILDASEKVLLGNAAGFTMEAVASVAACTKGLVHYHFGTRTDLLVATNDRLWGRREKEWSDALGGQAPEECIRQTWSLLAREAAMGVTQAWLAMLVDPDRAVNHAVRVRMDRFGMVLTESSRALLDRLGLIATIPRDEWSRLIVAGIDGVSIQLIGRARAPSLEAAYSAVWLSALGLTKPKNY